MKLATYIPVIVTFFCLAGCSVGEDEVDPVQGCNDLKEATVSALVRCGATEEKSRAAYEDEIDCEAIEAIDDQDKLYDECIPTLESIECGDLLEAGVPESCEGQLLR